MTLGIVVHRLSLKRVLTAFVIILASMPPMMAQAPNSQVLAFTGTISGQLDGPVAVRLRLYNANSAGTLLFEETQTVMVVSETFTVRIGDATAGGVHATLFRDNSSLWIAFASDSAPGVEIGLRTAITSGGYAHAAALLSGPMVRTVNGLVGDVTLAPGPNVTITPSGSTLTIDARTGLTTISRDATLIGNGTSGSPLGVAAPLQLTSISGGAAFSATNNGSGNGVQGTANAPLGSAVFGYNSTGYGVRGVSDNGFAAVIGSSTGGGLGVYGTTNGAGFAGVKGEVSASNGVGVSGVAMGAGGTGVWGSSASATGFGVYGSNSAGGFAGYFNGKVQVNDTLTTGSMTLVGPMSITAPTAASQTSGSLGIGTAPTVAKLHVMDTSIGTAVAGISASGSGVYRESQSASGWGVYGQGGPGYAMYANGNTGQARDKGGWAKAMIYVNEDATINRCFNSFLTGSAASTPPCGFSASSVGLGNYQVNFGFQVSDRFYSLSTGPDFMNHTKLATWSNSNISPTYLGVTITKLDGGIAFYQRWVHGHRVLIAPRDGTCRIVGDGSGSSRLSDEPFSERQLIAIQRATIEAHHWLGCSFETSYEPAAITVRRIRPTFWS